MASSSHKINRTQLIFFWQKIVLGQLIIGSVSLDHDNAVSPPLFYPARLSNGYARRHICRANPKTSCLRSRIRSFVFFYLLIFLEQLWKLLFFKTCLRLLEKHEEWTLFSQGAPSRRINMKLCSPVSSVFRPPLKLAWVAASLTRREPGIWFPSRWRALESTHQFFKVGFQNQVIVIRKY